MSRFRFGGFELDTRTGELSRDGQPVKLQPQPARVLGLLVARAGEIVLREDLKTHLWGEDTFVDFERGLNFCILQVRTALRDTSDNPRFVQTVPRKGYRFIAPVAMVDEAPADEATEGSTFRRPPTEEANVGSAFRRTEPAEPAFNSPLKAAASMRGWLLFGALAIIVALGVTWLATSARLSRAAGDATRLRVAVLPIANRTGDANADYVVDGLTDELIAGLGAVSPARLGVIARTSIMQYRDTTKTIAEIGRELDVSHVLEGSLRRDGDRLRVSAQLVTVADQTQVWADTFERTAADTMTLQADMAVRVARALAFELVPDVRTQADARARVPADAWDAYLQGRHWKNRGGGAAGQQALQRFEDAVRIDPTFAAAWAEIADTRHFLVMIGALSPRDAYPRAVEAADRALTLDPSLAAAHVARGSIALWYDWSPSEAARLLERALALNPSDADGHHDYAWAMVALGRFDEAVAQITAARDLDPLSLRANTDIGWLRLHLRQPSEAERACRHTLALDPASLDAQACLERAFVQRGLFDDAWRAARASLPPGTDLVAHTAGAATARDHVRAVWQWRLQRLAERAKTGWVSPYNLATHELMLGDIERVWPHLDAAFRERVGMLAFLHTDPVLDPLRADPRFSALAARVGESAAGGR